MKRKHQDLFTDLRKHAKNLLLERKTPSIDVTSLEDAKRLIAELQIHQIELEMQTDELRQAQAQLALEREKYADLYNFAPVAYFIFDERDIIIDLNLTATQLLGNSRRFLLNRPIAPYITAASLQIFVEHRQQALETRSPQTCELILRPRNGTQICIQAQTIALYPLTDGIQLWRSVMVDITERKKAEEQLKESQALYESLVNILPQSIYRIDLDERLTFINETLRESLGLPLEQVIGKTAHDFYPPDLAQKYHIDNLKVIETGKTLNIIEENNSPLTGEKSIVEVIKIPILDSDGKIFGIQGIFWDITERKLAEMKLRESEEKFHAIIENSREGIMLIDEQGIIIEWNSAQEQLMGIPRSEAVGQPAWEIQNQQMPPEHFENLTQTFLKESLLKILETGHAEHFNQPSERVIKTPDGETKFALQHTFVIKTARGYRLCNFAHDITQRKQAEQELQKANEQLRIQLDEIQSLQASLREQAIRDGLTGLYNRRYLNETSERELSHAERDNYPISIMMIDIDYFKRLNDTHGHQAGDDVLKALSSLLHNGIRQSDIACRYGGEEFIILMPEVGRADAIRRADALRKEFSSQQVYYQKEALSATISIGIATYPENGTTMDEVIKAADSALYAAKQAGRNCVRAWET